MRVPQPDGVRGSLMWIQRAVEHHPFLVMPPGLAPVDWISPRRADDMAEYRDGSALKKLGFPDLRAALAEFWPARGPQWDALGLKDGAPVLVEAKSHIDEFLTPGTAAGAKSLAKIEASLKQTADYCGARPAADWSRLFYQYANRLAHLYFFHRHGVPAHLVFVSFLGDRDMGGPETEEAWHTAFRVADHALGLPKRHRLTPFIHHLHPHVDDLD